MQVLREKNCGNMGIGRKAILYSIALLGAIAISSQIILIRELFTVFYGNELSFGFILALWLLGGSLGSGLAGRFFADRIREKSAAFSSALIALALLMPTCVIFARVSGHFFGFAAGEIINLPALLAISATAVLPVSALLGFLFVMSCEIISQKGSAFGIGRAYTLESFGAMAGGTITSLILIRSLGGLEIAFILSFLSATSACALAQNGGRGRGRMGLKVASLTLAAFILFLVASGLMGRIDKKSFEIKWAGFQLRAHRDSVYGRTVVTQKNSQFDFFSNGLFLFSSDNLLAAEEAAHFPLALLPETKTVLLIGSGASEAINEILKHPVMRVDYLELDPLVIFYTKEFLNNRPYYRLDDPRVNVLNEDGRRFIKNTKERYDAVILCMPNPYTAQINRFYTKEFFKELKQILSPSASVGFSVSSSENYLSPEQVLFLKTIFQTARSEFKHVKIVPGNTAHFLLAEKEGVITLDSNDIDRALKSKGIKTLYMTKYRLSSKLSSDRISYLLSAIRSVPPTRINTDFHPVSYFYDMILWSTYFNSALSEFFKFFTKKILFGSTAVALLVLSAVFFFAKDAKNFRKKATLLALGTTGFSEISFQVLTVLAFQIIYGYLYYMIGIIVTSFMFGLWMGSRYIIRRMDRVLHPYRAYTAVQVSVFLYPFVLLGLFHVFSRLAAVPLFGAITAGLFAIMPFIAGLVGGVQYPLASKICFEKPGFVGKTAGSTYAADLMGAFIGAFVISAFFIPLAGISLTCVLLAALNGVSLIILLAGRKTDRLNLTP